MALPIWCGGMKTSPANFDFRAAVERLCIRDHKPEAVAVHGETSGDEVLVRGSLRQSVAVGIHRDQGAALTSL